MAASRIFIKGLPPTFTDADFRKHFSKGREITDAKIFPNRRIGYVGYKTPEDAQKAVKYFNKSFIRMSKIGVELARPIQDEKASKHAKLAPTSRQGPLEQKDGREAGSGQKRKRDSEAENEDPQLQEFLQVMKPKSKKKNLEQQDDIMAQSNGAETTAALAVASDDSDDEYERVPKKKGRSEELPAQSPPNAGHVTYSLPEDSGTKGSRGEDNQPDNGIPAEQSGTSNAISDSDWARSRTSRLLGLLDEDEEEEKAVESAPGNQHATSEGREPTQGGPEKLDSASPAKVVPTSQEEDEQPASTGPVAGAAPSTMRLFIRNLPYDVKQEDLEAEFLSYGNLEEVHVALDNKSGAAKGFAYVQFSDSSSAEQAMAEKDGQTFQGRIMHVLPANAKRESKLDDFELSKLPLKKQQQIKKRRDAATATFNWNALYMNADAVVSSIADRLGLSKADVLDPTSSDSAIKQAHAETHIIQETKAYFRQQGVDLDSFKRSQRGDTAILVKNIPYDRSKDELRQLFEEHGDIRKFLMPPSGTLAIIEFTNAAQCKAAFGALAYRKVGSSVLFLEKAPHGLFDAITQPEVHPHLTDGMSKVAGSDLKDTTVPDTAGSATLYVRNLNFSTTSERLTETFHPLDGFLTARVKTKTDPKKPGQILSMGFGFLEFRSSFQAQAALKAMDGYTLEGHKLQIRASHKGADAAEERKRADAEKRSAGRHTKVIIKNLPFETSKKDVRALFGAYGQLRSVRVPKKLDRTARGFAFADFVTPKEAENAMDALRDTHLLGRRLVLELAAEDPADAEAEIERMQEKVGRQVNKVALQKLTSGGRKKFTTQNDGEED